MSSNVVIKGNRPLRIFAGMMLLILFVGHFFDSVNLLEPSVFWLMIAMSVNALQASFTGFCPMFKDKEGNCAACGVQCCESQGESQSESQDASQNKTAKELSQDSK